MTDFAPSVALALGLARIEARSGHAPDVEPGHLLLGLTKLCHPDLDVLLERSDLDPAQRRGVRSDAARLRHRFARAGVDPTELRYRLRAELVVAGPALADDAVPHRSPATWKVFTRADQLVPGRSGAVQLLRAVLESLTPQCQQVFDRLGVANPLTAFFPQPSPVGPGTPFVDRYGRDLTALAKAGELGPLIGRETELLDLARVLIRQRKANAVLVGPAGVGKTGIVEGLAARLTLPGAPAGLAEARVVEVSMAALVAGTKYRGEFEQRLQALLAEARRTPELILFIDELHTVLGAGGKGASDAANILKPALARGELRCIGATTTEEYRRYIEADPALERRFTVIRVEEPPRAEAVEILAGLRERLAAHHGVEISADVPAAAVDLSIRYLPELRLPDKAIDLVDLACAAARITTLSPGEPGTAPRIGPAEVAAMVAERTRIPVERIAAGEAQRLLGMEDQLRRRVIGQDAAIAAVAEAVRTSRAGLGDPRRPVGVFLFAGPTGTGKTELAKALAEFLFDDERRLIRIDMSEYQERHSVSRLLGAPPGYLGHDREGQLSGQLRDHPHSVVLFDEVEKAHPDVLDLFLQIFDEGQLTDARGRRISFTETVVILTSNLGSATPARRFGFAAGTEAAVRDTAPVLAALRAELRPELLGRIGRVVVFDPLTRAALRQVVDKVVDRLADRLAARRITLELTTDAYDLVLQQGIDAPAGARALEQAVDRLLVQPLGRDLLAGRFADGTAVRVDAAGGELVLTVADRWSGAAQEELR